MRVNVGSLDVESNGNDLASSSVVGSGGGFINSNSTVANTEVIPHILAAIDNGASVNVTNSITIAAKSSPEGDSNAALTPSGAVAVGESYANTLKPTVESLVGGKRAMSWPWRRCEHHVRFGGFLTATERHLQSGRCESAMQNTITLVGHALSDGSQVQYRRAIHPHRRSTKRSRLQRLGRGC